MSHEIGRSEAADARDVPPRGRPRDWAVRAKTVRPAEQNRDGFPVAALVTAGTVAAGILAWFIRWCIADEERRGRDRVVRVTPLTANARRALATKRAHGAEVPEPPSDWTAGEGMRPIPNTSIAPSGALEQEGCRPVLERSRKVR